MNDNILNQIATLALAALALYAPFWLLKSKAPALYRGLTKINRPLMNQLFRNQAKRRGFTFALCVHCAGVAGIAIILSGILTGMFDAVLAGLCYLAIAIVVGMLFRKLRSLKRSRYMLPGRRR